MDGSAADCSTVSSVRPRCSWPRASRRRSAAARPRQEVASFPRQALSPTLSPAGRGRCKLLAKGGHTRLGEVALHHPGHVFVPRLHPFLKIRDRVFGRGGRRAAPAVAARFALPPKPLASALPAPPQPGRDPRSLPHPFTPRL